MTLSATDVCNMALDILHEAPLTAYTTDGTRVANWFVRNYETMRDAEFEAHPWVFARADVSITVNATAPAFGWLYRYALPSDFMRIGYLNYDGYFEQIPIPHAIASADPADVADLAAAPKGWLYCDVGSAVKLTYIRQITDPSRWAKLFVQAHAAGMARQLSHWLTGKAAFVQIADALYKEAMTKARRANLLLSTPERAYDSDVISARWATGCIT